MATSSSGFLVRFLPISTVAVAVAVDLGWLFGWGGEKLNATSLSAGAAQTGRRDVIFNLRGEP